MYHHSWQFKVFYNQEWCGLLKLQNPPRLTRLLHTSKSFPNSSIKWGANTDIYEPMGDILIQNTIGGCSESGCKEGIVGLGL